MSWLELDDGILEHPKFIRAVKLGGSEVVHLWLGLRAYCGKHLTDGAIPKDMLDEVRGPANPKKRAAALAALLTVGLLDDGEGLVRMHDFLDWSSSRDDVLAARERARERKARSRGGHAVTPTVTPHGVTPVVTNPSPHLSTPLLEDPPLGPPGDRDIAIADLNSFAPDPAPKPQKKPRKAPSTPFPPDLQPLPRQAEKCKQLQLNCAEEFEKFSARHQSTGALFADWHRAFDTWIARAPEFRRPVPGQFGRQQEVSPNVDHDTRKALHASRRVREFLEGAK